MSELETYAKMRPYTSQTLDSQPLMNLAIHLVLVSLELLLWLSVKTSYLVNLYFIPAELLYNVAFSTFVEPELILYPFQSFQLF